MPRSDGIIRGDDRQRLIPLALVKVLVTLIDSHMLDTGPSSVTVELKNILFRLCRLYKIDYAYAPARETEMAQQEAEADGIPQEDTI